MSESNPIVFKARAAEPMLSFLIVLMSTKRVEIWVMNFDGIVE
jgi:hypothetical protein